MTKPGEAISQVIDVLSSLGTDDRQRTLSAVQSYFGSPIPTPTLSSSLTNSQDAPNNGDPDAHFPTRASIWMKQNNISIDDIESVYHLTSSGAELIAPTIPGKSKKEQTFNAYTLLGIGNFLSTGIPAFDDKDARNLCVKHGCYDPANHAAYFKDKGNELVGSKDKGWTLTAPGLKTGAGLLKELAKAE